MENPVSWGVRQIKRFNDLIWNTPLHEISIWRTFIIKQLRIIVLATRGFLNDKVQLRASALTLYSLLAIIPIAAIAFAIAKGFNLNENLNELLTKNFKSHPEVLDWLIQTSQNAIQATKGGYMAGIGVIILFWSAISLLNHIESSFNHIWQIRSSRPWYRKFTDYLTIMLIAPVFIILSSSINLFISNELSDFMAEAFVPGFLKTTVSLLIKFIPYFISWFTLTILFIIMPNAKVKFAPALISGIITGTILQIVQWVYIDLQYGLTKLNAIYGSFAAFPLFLIWLQSSWIMVLLGAELTFANQNVSRYEFESEALNISNHQKRALVLLIMKMIIRNFSSGDHPIGAEHIATTLKIPVRLVRDILEDLSSVHLVTVIHENEHKQRLYQPAIDINKLTVSFVFSRLDRKGVDQIPDSRNKDYEKVISMLDKFDRLIAKSDSNVLIKEL